MVSRLKYATLNGIRFEIEEHEREQARHVVKYQIPYADGVSLTEDMGPKAEPIRIKGFVSGAESRSDISRIERVLATATSSKPAWLMHPYYNFKKVYPESFQVSEKITEQRKIPISMDLIEVKNDTGSVFDKIMSVVDTVEDLKSDLYAEFENVLQLTRVPNFILSKCVDNINEAADFITSKNGLASVLSEYNELNLGEFQAGEVPDFFKSNKSRIGGLYKTINGSNRFVRSKEKSEQAQPFISLVELSSLSPIAAEGMETLPTTKGLTGLEYVERVNKILTKSTFFHGNVLFRLGVADHLGYISVGQYEQTIKVVDWLRSTAPSHKIFQITQRYKKKLNSFKRLNRTYRVKGPTNIISLAHLCHGNIDQLQKIIDMNDIVDPFNIREDIVYIRE